MLIGGVFDLKPTGDTLRSKIFEEDILMVCESVHVSFSNLLCNSFIFRGGDLSKDPDVLKAVTEQTKQWTEMMGRHRKEEWAMLSAHIQTQEDIFKKIFSTVEAKQMKEMDAFFAK